MSFPRYPEYKDSGVEWLGQVPSHWSIKRIKHIVRLLSEKSPDSSSPVALENIESWSGRFIETDSEYEGEGVAFIEGDVLFGKLRPYLAKVLVAFRSGQAVGDFHVLRPSSEIEPRFLRYFMVTRSFIDVVDGSTFGSKMPRASWDFVGMMPIVLPDSNGQRQIVNFLDHETAKIDALIAEQEKLIELLKEKRQAVISHAVTKGLDPNVKMKDSGVEWLGQVPEQWFVLSIKRLSAVQRGASPRPIDDPIYFDESGAYSWVRISDVSSSSGRLYSTEQKLSDLGSSLSVKIEPGSLFVSIAATVGKPCISEIRACIHDGFVYFPNLEIDPMWLYRIFEAGFCYAGLGKLGTQLNLNTDTIGSIKISLPPVDELQALLIFLEDEVRKIDALIDEQAKAVSLLQERRAALISAAVTGQIDVRNFVPEAEPA